MGQHFLVDDSISKKIIEAAEVCPEDTIIEVGPGLGALTRELVQRAQRVIAIEMDGRLATSLQRSLKTQSNLTVINADARQVDISQVLGGEDSYKLVANLPYYAANPILRRFLELEQPRASIMVVMVQDEVARSMVAEDGRMSLLAVGIQLYGIPRIVCTVPPAAFKPPPKINSAVVRIDIRPQIAIDVENVTELFDIVRAGFSAPRKQLRNSLRLGLSVPTDQATSLLEAAGLNPSLRAENLSLEDWGSLYRASKEIRKSGSQSFRQD